MSHEINILEVLDSLIVGVRRGRVSVEEAFKILMEERDKVTHAEIIRRFGSTDDQ